MVQDRQMERCNSNPPHKAYSGVSLPAHSFLPPWRVPEYSSEVRLADEAMTVYAQHPILPQCIHNPSYTYRFIYREQPHSNHRRTVRTRPCGRRFEEKPLRAYALSPRAQSRLLGFSSSYPSYPPSRFVPHCLSKFATYIRPPLEQSGWL